MGQATVIVTYKITPEGLEVNLDKLQKELEKFQPQKMEIEPIAFGLNAIIMVKVLPEIEGEADRFAEKIQSIKGVQTVDIIEMTRGL
ncbi:MAG: elongation factor 1-beta [Candidatus Aenigmatarchaeota archaeon]|nr:elongation factor 1-beta [Candidatus Aenigmarchaeota archaeon]